MKKLKKLLCVLLTLVMVLSIAPVTAGAANNWTTSVTTDELSVGDTVQVGTNIVGTSNSYYICFCTLDEQYQCAGATPGNGESLAVGSSYSKDGRTAQTNGTWTVFDIRKPTAELGGHILLYPSHSHQWEFGTVGNKLTMYCKVKGCIYYTANPTSSSYYIQINSTDATYDGSAHGVTTSSNTIPDVTISSQVTTYYTDPDCKSGTETTQDNSGADSVGGAPKKPGRYYVRTAVTINTVTYYIYTNFKIDTADQVATINDFSTKWNETYNTDIESGKYAKPGLTFTTNNNTPAGTVKIYYSKTNDYNTKIEWGSERYIEPGTYYLFATVEGNDCYNPLEITEGKEIKVTGTEAKNFKVENVEKTYDGEGCSIDVASAIGNLKTIMKNPKITYSTTGEAGSYTSKNPVYTDADSYTVYYKINSRNYYEINGSATVTITPKEVTPIVTAEDKVYDGNADAEVSVTFAEGSFVGEDSLTMTGLTATFDDVDGVENTGKDAGTDKKVTVSEDSYKTAEIAPAEGTETNINNYTIKAYEDNENLNNITADIAQRKAEFVWDEDEIISCDRAEEDAPFGIIITNVPEGADDTFNITYEKKRENVDNDIPEALADVPEGDDPVNEETEDVEKTKDVLTLTVTGLGNSNYYLPEDSEEMPLSKTVDIEHLGELEWLTTELTHEKKWNCCDWVVVDVEDHEWKDGVCEECEYVCSHIGGEANCVDKAICEICGESYGELNPDNHKSLKHFEANAATTKAEGNIEYWYCDSCKKYFSDEAAAKEITKAATVIAKLPEAKTGDMNNIVLWLALMALAGGAVVGTTVAAKKRK